MRQFTVLFISSFLIISCNPEQKSGARENARPEVEVGEESISGSSPDSAVADQNISDMIILAMINNRLQYSLALLAVNKAKDPMFETFCEMLVDNHHTFQYYVARLALVYNIEIPKGLTPEDQAIYDRIENLQQDEFKKEFLDMIIDTHEKDIARYENVLKTHTHVLERGMIDKLLKTLHDHLRIAYRLRNKNQS